jgi:translation initiation factor IF-3
VIAIQKPLRVNERIRASKVRVIDDQGNQLGIMHPAEALEMAYERGLDLVEVAPEGKPSVCRIMDYGKYKYELSKRAKEQRKGQKPTTIKEIKFRPKTEEHDYQFKLRYITRFLEEEYKVKITVRFRGREMSHQELGRDILKRIISDLEELAVIEQPMKLEGRNIVMLIASKPDNGKKKEKERVKPAEQKVTKPVAGKATSTKVESGEAVADEAKKTDT